MIGLSEVAGLTRQSFYKQKLHSQELLLEKELILQMAHAIRFDHPKMGCRKMYKLLNPAIGRDRFERIILDNGLRVKRIRNYQKTTRIGISYFQNLIEGLVISGINQVWQSDITYIKVGDRFCYLVFIIDVFSRRIIGYQANEHLLAIANTKALQQAISLRKKDKFEHLIHHSDRGCQYSSNEYLSLLKKYGIRPSMCTTAWENAYAERVNGIIKNEYLIPLGSQSLKELGVNLRKAVRFYNEERPHWSLPQMMTPIQYERQIQTPTFNIKPMKIYQKV